MLNLVNTQTEIINALTNLKGVGNIPADTVIETYAGQIDLVKLSVNIINFPGILVNWTGGISLAQPEEPDDGHSFTLLVCTDSLKGLDLAMPIIDTLNANLLGRWVDDNGLHLFVVERDAPKPVFMTKTHQVVAYPIRVSE